MALFDSKPIGNFYEFFAGGGMARAGLGANWKCLFANDFDPKKGITYQKNWGFSDLLVQNIETLKPSDIPGIADIAWASFPCQDLSLAGNGAGLNGGRSGTFWVFWNLLEGLNKENRRPPIIVLENVCGTITSHNGKDFNSICRTFSEAGFRFGAVVIDAVNFIPQSRPRLFFVGVEKKFNIPKALIRLKPDKTWHPLNLKKAFQNFDKETQKNWVWWNLPNPPSRKINFSQIIEPKPRGLKWHSPAETRRLLSMMSDFNLKKVEKAKKLKKPVIGTIYKRTRKNENGQRIQRAEIRFDEVAGCLRTPGGGSSRQIIMIIEGDKVRSRLLSPREAARLMGLKDEYILPKNYNEAYHLAGDGVVVPVVEFLTINLLDHLLTNFRKINPRLKKQLEDVRQSPTTP